MQQQQPTMSADELATLYQQRWERFYVAMGVFHDRDCMSIFEGDCGRCNCGAVKRTLQRRRKEIDEVKRFAYERPAATPRDNNVVPLYGKSRP